MTKVEQRYMPPPPKRWMIGDCGHRWYTTPPQLRTSTKKCPKCQRSTRVRELTERHCRTCGIKLSRYNQNPDQCSPCEKASRGPGLLGQVTTLVLVCLALLAPPASATPDASYPELDTRPAGKLTQTYSNRICNQLERMRFHVKPCPRARVSRDLDRDIVAQASLNVTIYNPTRNTLTRYGWRNYEENTATTVHELLHRVRAARYLPGVSFPGQRGVPIVAWTMSENDLWWEEAAVEAVTRDVLPIFRRMFWPRNPSAPLPAMVVYEGRVRAFRLLSMEATGSKRANTKKARSFRAWFLKQSVSTRRRVLNQHDARRFMDNPDRILIGS